MIITPQTSAVTAPSVPTKDDFKRLQAAGCLGNQLKTWRTWSDFWTDYAGHKAVPPDATLTIRSWVRDSPFFIPTLRAEEFLNAIQDLQLRGANLDTVYVQQCPDPGITRILNFEAYRNEKFVWVTYGTHLTLNLRHDLEQNGIHLEGPKAYWFLKEKLGPDAWDDLQEIWDSYPFSVVEATRFSAPVGLRNRELLIWEVRDY